MEIERWVSPVRNTCEADYKLWVRPECHFLLRSMVTGWFSNGVRVMKLEIL